MTASALSEIAVGNSYYQVRSMKNLMELFDIIYQYFDQFYMLVMCSGGARQGAFVERLVAEETKSTYQYLLKRNERQTFTCQIKEESLHILIEAFITALLEPIRYRMEKEEAMVNIKFIGNFFADGWIEMERKLTGSSD